MALNVGNEQIIGGIKFFGLSLAGIRTSISMPDYGLCFDVAQGYPYLFNIQNFFISHAHLDHAAGIPYIISQKALHGMVPPKFFMPESLVGSFEEMMCIWQKMTKHQYKYEFVGMAPEQEVQIGKSLKVRAFQTIHPVDSLGYTIIETKKRLKSEYAHLSQNAILELKSRQQEISEYQTTPIVSFTGDTQIEFIKQNNFVLNSKILLLESTYLDERKSIDHAKKYGHTHLDEIIDALDLFNCEHIVLIHMSSRYKSGEIQKILDARIPIRFHNRVTWFKGR